MCLGVTRRICGSQDHVTPSAGSLVQSSNIHGREVDRQWTASRGSGFQDLAGGPPGCRQDASYKRRVGTLAQKRVQGLGHSGCVFTSGVDEVPKGKRRPLKASPKRFEFLNGERAVHGQGRVGRPRLNREGIRGWTFLILLQGSHRDKRNSSFDCRLNPGSSKEIEKSSSRQAWTTALPQRLPRSGQPGCKPPAQANPIQLGTARSALRRQRVGRKQEGVRVRLPGLPWLPIG